MATSGYLLGEPPPSWSLGVAAYQAEKSREWAGSGARYRRSRRVRPVSPDTIRARLLHPEQPDRAIVNTRIGLVNTGIGVVNTGIGARERGPVGDTCPPGTGKRHVAKALALLAVERGHRVLYRAAHQLLEDITEARELGTIRRYRDQLKKAGLLVIDDLFLRKLPASAGDELADVLKSRYENGSTIITSNRVIDDWPKLLGDVVS